MNKILWIVYPHSLTQPRNFVLAQIEKLARKENLNKLIPFETLPEQYQIPKMVLWQCLLALKIKPQKINEQIYFTAQNLKKLEQFMKRVEISWACPHILETCCKSPKKKIDLVL